MSDTPQPTAAAAPEPTLDPRRKPHLAVDPATQPAPADDTEMPQEPQQASQEPALPAPAPADLAAAAEPEPAADDSTPLADPADQAVPPQEPVQAASSAPAVPEHPVETPAPEPESQPSASSQLAMDTEPASEPAPEPAAEQSSSTHEGPGAAAAAAASIGREATSTPTTIYNQAASAGDVPAAVATPPPPAAGGAPDANGAGGEASRAKAGAAATSGLSRVAQLTARVEKDPLDGEAQLALLQDAESKGDLERTREVYEKFLAVFPDAAQQWIAYCNLELTHNLFDRVEAIFGRCCRSSTSVDLWRFYLDYIRRVNPIDPANLDLAKQARSVIGAAFEFALSHVGHDRRAGDIWGEYIAFLKEAPTRGTWEDQQKMDQLRKAFQRAVQAPLNSVEMIWQDYNAFENNLSKMTAKKFIAELSPAYMTARKTLRELRAQHDHLYAPLLPRRPDWSAPEEREAVEGWKRYLAFEETNPLELEDPNLLHQRVNFAYRKAISKLRFHPEIWYLATSFNLRMGRVEDAHKQLREGLSANKSSLLLAYTLADLEEGKPDLAAAYAIYDSLIEHLNARVAQLEADADAEISDAVAEREEVHAQQVKERVAEGGDEDTVDEREQKAEELEALRSEIRERRRPEIESVKKAVANVWITEMRFARRSDGLKQARNIFLRAKKSPNMAWQVVEASATMEMYWNSEPKVATNVFELGLKMFANEPDYILRYLEFLIQQNNANNARALFERSVSLLGPDQAKPIWDRMAAYEFQYGDHLAAQKMAKRYAEAFPDTPATTRFAQRHQHLGLEDAFAQDLGPSFVRQLKGDTRSGRSASPEERSPRNKRGLSAGPDNGAAAPAGYDANEGGDAKRPRHGPSPSPAPQPQSNLAGPGGPGGPPGGPGWNSGMGDHRRSAPQAPPALNRAQPYMLDPRGADVAILPDAVVFFLSLLPNASSFNGPHLNPATIMDIIGTTILPGSAPGPGLPGERLGIPPRPKPQRPAFGSGGPPGGGYGGARRY
ncbi:hypothetical protein JCM3775_004224 [Rhodotorula graminis]